MKRAPVLVLLSSLLMGCLTHSEAAMPDYPGLLGPPEELTQDFVWRQKIYARWGERAHSFEAVLQKKGDTLRLIGLTPYGAKAFVMEQRGCAISRFQSFLPEELPFPPRFILNDVHRAFLLNAQLPPRADGDHHFSWAGESVKESWSQGRLMVRVYSRDDGRPPGEILVRYHGGIVGLQPPAKITYANGWFGYVLEIETLVQQAL